ncbi:MAG: hypothetical protein WC829_02090 [Hyphomicrobium sp.]|jgi:hypothetical protein
MATLYISEYAYIGGGANGAYIGVAPEPPLAEQALAISGTSNPSAAFNAATWFIRVHTDAICSILVGSGTPVATGVKKRLPADHTEYFAVTPGHKLAVISNT